MLEVGSKVRLSVRGSWFGQQCQNVFVYENSGVAGAATPLEVAEAFWNHVKAEWRAIIAPELYFLSVYAEEIGGDLEFGEFVIPPGERTGTLSSGGDPLPTFNAAGIRLVPVNRTVRPGQKRFAGATEGSVYANNWLSGYQTALAALGAVITDNFSAGLLAVAQFSPRIWGEALPERTTKGGVVLPARPETFVAISGYLVSSTVTSQVSRKVGVGV